MSWSSPLDEMKPRPLPLPPAFSIRPKEVALFGLRVAGSGEPKDEACSTNPNFVAPALLSATFAEALAAPVALSLLPALFDLEAAAEEGLLAELLLRVALMVGWCSMKPRLRLSGCI